MKRLYRSQTDKKIAGVCGGIAEYFDIDPTIVRVGFVILLLPGGLPGIIPYLILWAVIPVSPATSSKA
jgi:phage shock protein PspC (stress-responsive transcriptional regulator)